MVSKHSFNLNFHSTFFESCQHSAKISPWLARQDFKKGTLKISIEANQKQFKIIIRFKLQSKRFDFLIKMFQKEYLTLSYFKTVSLPQCIVHKL